MTPLTPLRHFHRPVIMGILNATPDSFSDGGRFVGPDLALKHATEMVKAGADIIDIGGESTRPGSEPVGPGEQIARVIPIIHAMKLVLPHATLISIDTTQSEVAAAALDAGAGLINDISAGRDDPAMFSLAAERGVPIVLMHMQGTPKTMQDHPHYEDVVEDVLCFLLARVRAAEAAAVAPENIIIDPGIGFGKRREDNLILLANLQRFVQTGYPVLLGASRKRFMGAICHETRPHELIAATVATTTLGVMAGVQIFRVHDVRENRQAAEVTLAIKSASKFGRTTNWS